MTPFPAAPWTLDDAMVWRRFELTIGDLAVWRYVHADRLDAALMACLSAARDHAYKGREGGFYELGDALHPMPNLRRYLRH